MLQIGQEREVFGAAAVRHAVAHRLVILDEPSERAQRASHHVDHRTAQVARHLLGQVTDPAIFGSPNQPPVGRFLACNHSQERRLTRAVSAHQRHPFAGREVEVDAGEKRLRAVRET